MSATSEVTQEVKSGDRPRTECHICNKFVLTTYLRKHIQRTHGDKNTSKYLFCAHCDYKIKVKRCLEVHMNARHVVRDHRFHCHICKRAFKYNHDLKRHIETHSETRQVYTCTICNKTFLAKQSFYFHMRVKHSGGAVAVSCMVCGKTFSCQSYLNHHMQHMHLASAPLFHCHCGKSFAKESCLKKHSIVHSNVRNFKCSQCDKSFKTKWELNKHVRRHTDLRPFQCDQCSLSFKLKATLNQHYIVHRNTVPLECDYCKKVFRTKHYIKMHMLRRHKELISMNHIFADYNEYLEFCKKFRCDCGLAFRFESQLKVHMLTHSNVKEFKCKECDKLFKTELYLKYHMSSVHVDVRPFQCSVCSASFKRKHDWSRHVAAHSDNKPWNCEQCAASFSCKRYLDRHAQRVHSDIKPWNCEQCAASFSCKRYLDKHVQRVHK